MKTVARMITAMPGKKKLSKQRLLRSDLDWTALVAIVALEKTYMAASCANETYCTAVQSSAVRETAGLTRKYGAPNDSSTSQKKQHCARLAKHRDFTFLPSGKTFSSG